VVEFRVTSSKVSFLLQEVNKVVEAIVNKKMEIKNVLFIFLNIKVIEKDTMTTNACHGIL
jgi:hypothetical protein